jgi:probable HAF family extracellular repeat protein
MRRPLLFVSGFSALALTACDTDRALRPVPPETPTNAAVSLADPTTVEVVSAQPLPGLTLQHGPILVGVSPTNATDVNDAGVIVGWGQSSLITVNPIVWTNRVAAPLLTFAEFYAQARGINANGVIVGGNGLGPLDVSPARWLNTSVTQLVPGLPGASSGYALAINDGGKIVGYYTPFSANDPRITRFAPTLWDGSVQTDLLAGQSSGRAFDINNAGQIVGARTEGAFLWQNGVLTALPTLGGTSTASAINESAVIAGTSGNTAVRWQAGAIQALPGVPAGVSSANDINDFGQIVGTFTVSGAPHAFFWQDGVGMIDLGPGVATALNNRGLVVGTQTATSGAVVWTLNFGPVASLTGPEEARKNEALTFSAAASSDQNLDALTYAWDFGDGATGTGATGTHSYKKQGTYTVTVTVSDPRGLTSTASLDVSVENGKKPKKDHDNNGNGPKTP